MLPNNGFYAMWCISWARNRRLLVADVTNLSITVGLLLQQRRRGGTNTVIGMMAWSVAPLAACHLFGVLSVARAPNHRP